MAIKFEIIQDVYSLLYVVGEMSSVDIATLLHEARGYERSQVMSHVLHMLNARYLERGPNRKVRLSKKTH